MTGKPDLGFPYFKLNLFANEGQEIDFLEENESSQEIENFIAEEKIQKHCLKKRLNWTENTGVICLKSQAVSVAVVELY